METLKFPQNFLWGAATSAYQVEGGIKNNDWVAFKDAGRACEHYERFEKDFDLAKKLNNNAHRFSLEWSRLEPEQGHFNQREIQHYLQVVEALKNRGLEPFVTLHHFTNPNWFARLGGWLNPKAPQIFSEYVEKITKGIGAEIKFWLTFNEPLIYALNAFLIGYWPPHQKNFLKTIKVLKNLIKAHQKSYQIIHQIIPQARVAVAKSMIYFQGPLAFCLDKFWNQYFLNQIRAHQDFIGLNYYFRSQWPRLRQPREVSDLGWEIYPQGLYQILKSLKKFNQPIYITENGLADAQDSQREKFIKEHLFWLYQAIKEGSDARGYFHWSLMDNFEWAEEFEPRFGLWEMDYQTMERKPRPSARLYAEICRQNALIAR